MIKLKRELLLFCLRLLLRPVARFCVRHALRLQDFTECAKAALLDAASEARGTERTKLSTSKLSLMTGVHRKDVARIQKSAPMPDSYKDLVTKVVGLWQTDPRFMTKDGQPRVLTIDGDKSEFEQLVQSVSRELSPQAILSELERVHGITKAKGGIRLEVQSYVPKGDPKAEFQLLELDSSDLLRAVEENVLMDITPPNLHARTQYDNIRPDAIPALKTWFLREGHQFHARAREFISQFDQDVNPEPSFKGKGVRAVISAFSLVDNERDENEK